jgi:hypothetical protein
MNVLRMLQMIELANDARQAAKNSSGDDSDLARLVGRAGTMGGTVGLLSYFIDLAGSLGALAELPAVTPPLVSDDGSIFRNVARLRMVRRETLTFGQRICDAAHDEASIWEATSGIDVSDIDLSVSFSGYESISNPSARWSSLLSLGFLDLAPSASGSERPPMLLRRITEGSGPVATEAIEFLTARKQSLPMLRSHLDTDGWPASAADRCISLFGAVRTRGIPTDNGELVCELTQSEPFEAPAISPFLTNIALVACVSHFLKVPLSAYGLTTPPAY